MPPACSLLGKATPAPPEVQPFRFLDLPVEIRYMVYEGLVERRVRVTIPSLDLPSCVSCRSSEVLSCLYPAMLRVNKQLANEYVAVAMRHMSLVTYWRTCDHDTPLGEMHGSNARPPMLPEKALANLQFACLRISMNASMPHCDVHAVIRTLTSRMLHLRLFMLSSEYDIDPFVRETSLVPRVEFDKHRDWTDEMIYFLQNSINEEDSSWIALVKFQIICALYCLRDPSAEIGHIPDAIFALCEGPEEDTFKLDGLDLKFMGTDRLQAEQKAFGDDNVLILICPREHGSQDEE